MATSSSSASSSSSSSTSSSASSVGSVLASYLPFAVVNKCIERVRGTAWEPSVDEVEGAVVFCDISGFTKLTEKLAKEGPDGAEKLVAFLDEYFGELVSLVHAHGGDTQLFAGDALLAVWRRSSNETLAITTLRAVQCARQIETIMNSKKNVEARLHMGVGAGQMAFLQVGGHSDRWMYIASGEPLAQIGDACHEASPDHTVLSAEAWHMVKSRCSGEVLDKGLVRLTGVTDYIPPVEMPALPNISEVGALRMFVPQVIQQKTLKDQETWVAELRRVSVLFININDLDTSTAACLMRVHAVVTTVQNSIYHYEGIINKVVLDDKGFVIVAGFGLPPQAHENDPERACLAAALVKSDLNRLDVKCAIGVTTGRAFCGAVGSSLRREYTMMGDVVNTSARLMTNTHEEITIDSTTLAGATATNPALTFVQLPSKQFKGKATVTEIFSPTFSLLMPKQLRTLEQIETRGGELVGRSQEVMKLARTVDLLVNVQKGGIVLIEGELGMGKTRMLEEAFRISVRQGVPVYTGCGDYVERRTPFFPWRGVFYKMFGLFGAQTIEERTEKVRVGLGERFGSFAPLFNSFIDVNFPMTEEMSSLNVKERYDQMELVLFRLLKGKEPKVVLLDNLDQFDQYSRNLAVKLAEGSTHILIVATMRAKARPQPFLKFFIAVGMELIRLPHLRGSALVQMVARAYDVASIPQSVKNLIVSKCGGNPFFATELVHALLSGGLIGVGDGVCWVTEGAKLDHFPLPESLEGAITSRMDALMPQGLLTIKVASAIGPIFDISTLRRIHPHYVPNAPDGNAFVEDNIMTLLDLGLITKDVASVSASLDMAFVGRRETPLYIAQKVLREKATARGSDEVYAFVNALTHEITYALMLFKHRRELHDAVGLLYETTHFDSLTDIAAALSYHFFRGGSIEKGLHFVEVAAYELLARYHSDLAVTFLNEATGYTRGASTNNHARLLRLLARALYDQGEVARARSTLLEALALLGVTEAMDAVPTPNLMWLVEEAELRLQSSRNRELMREMLAKSSKSGRYRMPTDPDLQPASTSGSSTSKRRSSNILVKMWGGLKGAEGSSEGAVVCDLAPFIVEDFLSLGLPGVAAAPSAPIRAEAELIDLPEAGGWARWPINPALSGREEVTTLVSASDLGWYSRFFFGVPHVLAVCKSKDMIVAAVPHADLTTSYRVLIILPERTESIVVPKKELGLKDSAKALPSAKQLIAAVFPPKLHKASDFSQVKDVTAIQGALRAMENKLNLGCYKLGVMYVRGGQTDESAIYTNTETTPEYEEFLTHIGQHVRLAHFPLYSAGLDDSESGTSGSHSIFADFQGLEVMCHVTSLLPPDPLCRKQFIGSDRVVIAFVETEEALPLGKLARKINHVFIVVRLVGPSLYKVRVAVREDVLDLFSGSVPLTVPGECLGDYLLALAINADTVTYQAKTFAASHERLRRTLIQEVLAAV